MGSGRRGILRHAVPPVERPKSGWVTLHENAGAASCFRWWPSGEPRPSASVAVGLARKLAMVSTPTAAVDLLWIPFGREGRVLGTDAISGGGANTLRPVACSPLA